MRTTMFAALAVSVAWISPAPRLLAQSSAQIFDYRASNNACLQTSNNPSSSISACPPSAVVGGTGAGTGTGDVTSRVASAMGNLTQTGGQNSMAAIVETRGYVYSTFTLAGTLPAQSYLVFHYNINESISAVAGASTSAFDYAFEGLYLNTPFGGAWHYSQRFVNGTATNFSDAAVTAVAGGLNYRFANTLDDGTYNYFAETATEEYMHASEAPGTTLSGAMWAYLQGVDLTDAQGAVLASATFGANGAALLDLGSEQEPDAQAAPEPATISLVALGLCGMIATRRKRARR